MMRRFFGRKDKSKKRLSPSARTPEGLVQSHPMYQYALNEFAQTVPAATSNDDGRSVVMSGVDPETATSDTGVNDNQESAEVARIRSRASSDSGVVADQPTQTFSTPTSPRAPQYVMNEASPKAAPPPMQNPYVPADSRSNHMYEPAMPDATYEEYYGDAYVGGPIRYVYPSGYQSMRPRGGPWKLSIIVCICFTWLSVFVIDHCSDRGDQAVYNQMEIDDDALVIETRWCGSRLLYLMWVLSMSITGLATAYCSIIGYIKVRDFVVANSRSQPPGMVGKSDYYVNIGDAAAGDGQYQKTIYQADGTPQFWGGHIYRPTQAAVAITSR